MTRCWRAITRVVLAFAMLAALATGCRPAVATPDGEPPGVWRVPATAGRQPADTLADCSWLAGTAAVVRDHGDLVVGPPDSALTPMWPERPIVPRFIWRVATTGRFDHTTELGWLLVVRGPPRYPENPYVDVTRARAGDGGPSRETRLARRLVDGPGGRTPADILAEALAVAEGDYPLAMLVAHNLLKELAYADRLGGEAVVGWPPRRDDLVSRFDDRPTDRDVLSIAEARRLAGRLVSLRAADDPSRVDHLGPWYHLFGVLLVGALGGEGEARLVAEIENGVRRVGVGSPRDPGKERVNTCAADLAARIAAR